MVARLHREVLQRPDAAALGQPAGPGAGPPDVPRLAATRLLARQRTHRCHWCWGDGLRLGFFTVLTAFSWPQQITLDELRLEATSRSTKRRSGPVKLAALAATAPAVL